MVYHKLTQNERLEVNDMAHIDVPKDVYKRQGAARTSNIDHFCHLSAGNGTVRLERAVLKTVDYAEGSKSVHSLSLIHI